jgi:hypothetical protein
MEHKKGGGRLFFSLFVFGEKKIIRRLPIEILISLNLAVFLDCTRRNDKKTQKISLIVCFFSIVG